jgi:hypothetical protein
MDAPMLCSAGHPDSFVKKKPSYFSSTVIKLDVRARITADDTDSV